MPMRLSANVTSIHTPPISEVIAWRDQAPADLRIIDLCQAVPNYPPAAEMVTHLQTLLTEPQMSRYSPDEGLAEVREAICARYARRYQGELMPEQICLTVGASQAFWLAITTVCQAGDEVIVQTPYYFDHPMALAALGIKAVCSPYTDDAVGLPDSAAIAGLITPRTRAILLVTPSNPTGVITSPDIIDELYELAARHDIALIVDETYADFLPGDQPPHRLFSRPDWGETFIHLMSFGKTYALTGYRAGLLAGSRRFISNALKIQDTMVVCQPRITQHAIMFGVTRLDEWVAANRDLMTQRHDAFCRSFTRAENPFSLIASGTFFAWVRHPYPAQTGREVARLLVNKSGLLVLPGEVFGPGLTRYLRIAFGNLDDALIPEAVSRFCTVQLEGGK